jgi:hypothetical protein
MRLAPILALLVEVAAAPSGPLPPEATALPVEGLLAGVDVRALLSSASWNQLTSGRLSGFADALPRDQADKMQAELQQSVAKGLAEARQKWGVQLDRELDRVVIVAGAASEKEPGFAVLALGRFEPARVGAALEASQKAAGATPAHRSLEGAPLLLWTKAGQPQLAAALGATSVIIGSPGLVERAVVNRAGRVDALAASPRLQALVRGLRPDAGLWAAADESVLQRSRPAGAAPPPFPMPLSLTLQGQIDGGLELIGEMADEGAATNLADVVRGGLGMARLQARNPPTAPDQARMQEAIVDLLASIAVQQHARTVRITYAPGGGAAGGIGTLAAIAVPSLLRARVSANEAAAIGDIRTVISAEATYSASNRGAYGELGCLSEPGGCLPHYTGPRFLDSKLTSLENRSGYRRAFFPGKPTKAGSKGLSGFAYTATPLEPGTTGVRSFCGDSNGVVCADPRGAAIQPVAGACPADCTPLN